MATLGISVLGAGRMGQELVRALAATDADVRLAAIWSRRHVAAVDEALVSADLDRVIAAGDVVIDFSLAEATAGVAAAAARAGKPLVCGVSGLDDAGRAAMARAADAIPLFYERNMSVGIALLRRIVADAGRVFGTAIDADIADLHHAGKRDAPSGTALLLGEALATARGQRFEDARRYDPDGGPITRRAGDIVYSVRREGGHPGHHTVRLSTGAETLTLAHDISDRRVFADGALRAARWLHGRGPGRYDMQDLLADTTAAS